MGIFHREYFAAMKTVQGREKLKQKAYLISFFPAIFYM
jgi:hypothetical protein